MMMRQVGSWLQVIVVMILILAVAWGADCVEARPTHATHATQAPDALRGAHAAHACGDTALQSARWEREDSLSSNSSTVLHFVRIVNRYFGAVTVSRDGRTWHEVGRVIRPVHGKTKIIRPGEFTAADWAAVGTVAATAANAIHLKVDQRDPHAEVFSILPVELAPGRGDLGSYLDEPSTIYLDVPAGLQIFGSSWAPPVGSPLLLEDGVSGELTPYPEGRSPLIGDRLVIRAQVTMPRLQRIVLENREGGEIRASFHDGTTYPIARVLRPVEGIGRFGGTKFVGPGLVRANHPAVICLSTSPLGEVGGVQIIPHRHAMDPALTYVWTTPAWLIIEPVRCVKQPSTGAESVEVTAIGEDEEAYLEGRSPLFSGALRPGGWRFRVRWSGESEFVDAPLVVGRELDSLRDVEAIVIEEHWPRGKSR